MLHALLYLVLCDRKNQIWVGVPVVTLVAEDGCWYPWGSPLHKQQLVPLGGPRLFYEMGWSYPPTSYSYCTSSNQAFCHIWPTRDSSFWSRPQFQEHSTGSDPWDIWCQEVKNNSEPPPGWWNGWAVQRVTSPAPASICQQGKWLEQYLPLVLYATAHQYIHQPDAHHSCLCLAANLPLLTLVHKQHTTPMSTRITSVTRLQSYETLLIPTWHRQPPTRKWHMIPKHVSVHLQRETLYGFLFPLQANWILGGRETGLSNPSRVP